MTALIYSPWLAAYLLVLQQVLMLTVGMYRTKKKQGMGFQDDLTLERLVRRHGNLAENAGIFITSIVLLELQVGSTRLVWVLCLAFATARTLHAIGFSSAAGAYKLDSKGIGLLFLGARALGALSTAFTGIVCGFALAIAGSIVFLMQMFVINIFGWIESLKTLKFRCKHF
ncbi:MAG: MAPEG family protein [Microcoleaceae cyanobacterium]